MFKKISKLIGASLPIALACLSSAGAAESEPGANVSNPHTLAMQNSTHLLNYLTGLNPALVAIGLDHIEHRRIQRIVPTYPVWILDVSSSTILYYEGQPSFKYQPVEKLVDEAGQRFGLKTAQKAKASRSMWQRLTLGGSTHEMYCGQDHPFAVCTLLPKGVMKDPD